MDVISYLGGIINILFGLFVAIGTLVKEETMVDKVLRSLYFTPMNEKHADSGNKFGRNGYKVHKTKDKHKDKC